MKKKSERSDVKFPLWRKKVDSSLFQHRGTTIPNWVCKMWNIQDDFSECRSKNDEESKVTIFLQKKRYNGAVTIAPENRKTPAYRLWYDESLKDKLKDIFLMSFIRDIEDRLRKAEHKKKSKEKSNNNIEEEIPFWEFLDIEYDRQTKTFHFKAHYRQKPVFSELFKRFAEAPMLHKIYDELDNKKEFRIYKSGWVPRENLDSLLNPQNVLYVLIDTKNKLLYVGEAKNLKKRLNQEHNSIPHWDFFRYNILPSSLAKPRQRKTFERMVIRDYASILENKKDIHNIRISEYKLTNDKIDSR